MKKSEHPQTLSEGRALLVTVVALPATINMISIAPYLPLPFSMPVRIAIMVVMTITRFLLKERSHKKLLGVYVPLVLYIYGCFRVYRSPFSWITVLFTIGLLSFVFYRVAEFKYGSRDEKGENEDVEEEDKDLSEGDEKSAPAKIRTAGPSQNASKKKSNKKKKRH